MKYQSNTSLGIDIYLNKMFKIIMLIIPSIAIFAGSTFTVFKLVGFYPDVNLYGLIGFDLSTLIYFVIGFTFFKTCEDSNHHLKKTSVFLGKIFVSILVAIQWNFISYMIPSRDFWGYFPLFIICGMFFLDHKYLLINDVVILGSMFISWIIRPELLPPTSDPYYVPEIILRLIVIVFVTWVMWFITFLVEKFLLKELEKVAEYDTLTLLKNRRTLEPMLKNNMDRYQDSGEPFCFVMCDIDDFKKVNDTYGHDTGDKVLIDIAHIFQKTIDTKGQIFRYGGEEICCIINLKLDAAYNLINELRENIQNFDFVYGSISIKITMSFGLVEYKNDEDIESLIKYSDTNLYYAKSHGKNVVIR